MRYAQRSLPSCRHAGLVAIAECYSIDWTPFVVTGKEVDCDKTTLEKKREIANHRVRGEYETLRKSMLQETGIPVLPGR